MPSIYLKDERIEVTYYIDKQAIKQQIRKVAICSDKYNKVIVYITYNFEMTAVEIAAIYENRWQIETCVKKLKQHFALTILFGNKANAIEIKIWRTLIAFLLLDVTQKAHYFKMPFSILATFIRLYIIRYIGLSGIIEAYKLKRKRIKSSASIMGLLKKTSPALQMKFEM